jgi:hypothetical protein
MHSIDWIGYDLEAYVQGRRHRDCSILQGARRKQMRMWPDAGFTCGASAAVWGIQSALFRYASVRGESQDGGIFDWHFHATTRRSNAIAAGSEATCSNNNTVAEPVERGWERRNSAILTGDNLRQLLLHHGQFENGCNWFHMSHFFGWKASK